jgi:hypothetical protein
MAMRADDEEFLYDMVTQLDETIKQLVIEEKIVADKIGNYRVEELREFWKQDLSEEEEKAFRLTMDHWDKVLIRLWSRSKRIHHTRAQVGHTLMKSISTNNHKQEQHE